jgi:hypothetical protein
MAMGQVLVDGGTMLHCLRRDSDRLRGVVASNGLIQTLSVVPAMANEMHVMNSSMATMGSTMGKMGNIVPWW